MAINRTNIGRQLVGDLGNFVGQDINSQFSRKPQKLAEGGVSVGDDLGGEGSVTAIDAETGEITYTYEAKIGENGYEMRPARSFKYNPEDGYGVPSTSGRRPLIKKGQVSAAGEGSPEYFRTAEAIEVEAAPASAPARKKKEVTREIVNRDDSDAPTLFPSVNPQSRQDVSGLKGRAIAAGFLSPLAKAVLPLGLGNLIPEDKYLNPADPAGGKPLNLREDFAGYFDKEGAIDPETGQAYKDKGGINPFTEHWRNYQALDRADTHAKDYALQGLTGEAREKAEKEYQTKGAAFAPIMEHAGKLWSFDRASNEWVNERGERRNTTMSGEWVGKGWFDPKGYQSNDLTNPNHPRHQEWKDRKASLEDDDDDDEKDPTKNVDVTSKPDIDQKEIDKAKKELEAFRNKISGVASVLPPGGFGVMPQGFDNRGSPGPAGGAPSGGGDTGGGGAGLDMDSARFLQEIGLGFTPAFSNTDAQGEWSSDPSIDWNDPVAVTGWEGAEDDGTWNALVASGGAIPFARGGGLSSMVQPDQHINPGDFVISADVVSGVGDGSSAFGFQRLAEEFGIPQSGPFQAALGGEVRGPGGGLDDFLQTSIAGKKAALLSNQEMVVPRDIVAKAALRNNPKLSPQQALKQGQDMFYNLMTNVRSQKNQAKGGNQPAKLKGSLASLTNPIKNRG